MIDDAGNKLGFSYDDAGNILVQEDVTSGGTGAEEVSYTREDDTGTVCGAYAGQVCTSTDGEGNTTTYSYDADGNLTEVDPPGPLGSTTYVYDSISRLVEVTDGNNQTRELSYDTRDRLLATVWEPGPTGDAVYYSYDLDGNELTQTDQRSSGTTVVSRQFDALGRVTLEEDPSDPQSVHHMTHDDVGNMLTMVTVGGTTSYTYDDADQLTHIALPGGSCPSTGRPAAGSGCIQFEYDKNGAVTDQHYPGGASQSTARDESGRPTTITAEDNSGVFADVEYSYTSGSDDRVFIQSRIEDPDTTSPATTEYEYDSLRRLTAADTTTAGSISPDDAYREFSYDDAGNLTRSRTQYISPYFARTVEYRNNTSGQLTRRRIDQFGQAPAYRYHAYDQNGNEISRASTWTMRDQLAGYNTTDLDYHGELNDRLTSIDSTQIISSPLGVTAIAPPAPGIKQTFTLLPDGTPIAITRDGDTSYFFTDPVGSVTALTSDTGDHEGTYEYTPYGELLNQGSLTAAAASNPIRYAGGLHLSDIEKVKFGSRYYDPVLARFTQMDPSGQEPNPYNYARSNPINYADPTGQNTLLCVGAYAGVGVLAVSDAYGMAGLLISAAAGNVPGAIMAGAGIVIGAGFNAVAVDYIESEC
ncbi:RHS repeat-associated core domain-containing protein [Phytoactinopolyspora alkaliphila]|uniref:RHS repeat-associated core domain-containing protein n=1 Tax=Phytoactinopolyspora alkaliphila TaxID=1783498 RepID=A0A6N9YQ54_9ACTN|nr:RHS repeat-associated core domain-containing protein [Phytoactinopolyspora alkaliphila]